MSARDDYPTDTATECYETMCDEIDRLRAELATAHEVLGRFAITELLRRVE